MRQLTLKRFFALALLMVLSWGTAARAAPPTSVTPADTKAVQRVIQAQLNAFAADDEKRAFSYAAPGIRKQFGNAETFMAMVRQGYPMVYRPANVVFQKPTLVNGTLIQAVVFSDLGGDEWVATYRMQRQKNKIWLIDGCMVEPSAGRGA